MTTNTISGTYTTRRNGGLRYTYEANWRLTEQGAVWDAKVRHDGELVGTPTGEILDTHGIDYPTWVRRLVEASIEERAGVE